MQLLAVICGLTALVAAGVSAQTSYCNNIVPRVPQCATAAPRDLLFLVDGSQSMNRDRFFREMLDYCLSLYCAFQTSSPNQAGMIIFNQEIKVVIPLAQYSQTQWFNQVETVRATKDGPNPACCSCCTPTAEAFDLATEVFAARGVANALSISLVITDGVPSNNIADTGGNPAWWWYNRQRGFNPATYNMVIVPQRANVLKAAGHRLFLVGVPNVDNVPPQQNYFNGRLPRNSRQCVRRATVNFCATYSVPPFPITSTPVDKNSFSSNTWNVTALITQTIGALCEILPTPAPTKAPTTRAPTKTPTTLRPTTLSPTSVLPTPAPTLGPTVTPPLEQVDVTFLIDRSRSMLFHDGVCKGIIERIPRNGISNPRSYCWELFMQYVLAQADALAAVPAGLSKNRPLGWASDFPGVQNPAKGLRVNLIGFACQNNQRTPKVFPYSLDLNGGPIGSRAALVTILETMRTAVLPDGGTCPGLAIETAVRYIESTSANNFPLQSTILITDGVFYDSPFPQTAVSGLAAYQSLRFAVGIAVARENFDYGLTKKEIAEQRKQLKSFVGDNAQLFKNLDTAGWEVLPQIAQSIANDLPNYYYLGQPIPRYTWCGWRRIGACRLDSYRMKNCAWKKKKVTSWGCSKA